MAATPEKTCLPQGKQSKAGYSELCPSKPEGQTDCPDPSCSQDLLQQFNQLQERFQRTTNALASAAHDLKTPLAILNGYVELLQSEKLGGLNDRQREDSGRYADQRPALAALHTRFPELQCPRNRRDEDAFRAGRSQYLSVGSLPPVVAFLPRKRAWHCTSWPTKN